MAYDGMGIKIKPRNTMKAKYILHISCAILLCCTSCRNSTKQENQNVKADNYQVDSTKSIDFFGERLYGTYEDIINRIYRLPALTPIERRDSIKESNKDILYFSHTVEFCGVPCGMNVRLRKEENANFSVNEVIFITSQTDKEIIQKFVSEISEQYGTPESPEHARYDWWWHDQRICARHLHADEGGWTVFFYLPHKTI